MTPAVKTGKFSSPTFQENDLHLLETGNFADGTIKCQDRTWKVHRALLASRLKFFKAAFYGEFSEAASREVDFPEADPDSVDIMVRHIYRGDLDVRDMKTPTACVRCWRLADFLQLDSLKGVALSSLGQHLDAMALLASSDVSFDDYRPKWLGYFFDAFREVCSSLGTGPLHPTFGAFLWVTRFELLVLPETLDILRQWPCVHAEVMKLLVSNKFKYRPDWIPNLHHIERHIQNRKDVTFGDDITCSRCNKTLNRHKDLTFYNPFPVGYSRIGMLLWCKRCVSKFNEECCWPWRSGGGMKGDKIKLEAWTWSDED